MPNPLPNAAHSPLPGSSPPGPLTPGLTRPERLVSMDAYRGFVMVLMAAELLQFHRLHEAFPQRVIWGFLAYHQSHVEWAGCSLHDLIQPSFSFLVGVALPYSIASRTAGGQSFGTQFGHALRRSLILILLGIFLRSTHANQTYFTFEDTLSQIGLGYPLLFLIGSSPRPRTAWGALAAILLGYWLAYGLGICPVVKRIWTPAWVLFSGGLCFWLLAFFYYLIDVSGHQRWAFPLIVVGMNSIATYCLVHLIDGFIIRSFYTHLGHGPFRVFGPAGEPLLTGLATLAVFYAILWWMYRRKLFIRI